MRKCVVCNLEKELEKFRKRQVWYSHTCKLCYAKQYRTGKPNLTRFKKGCDPGPAFRKGHPNYAKKIKKERIKERKSESFGSVKKAQWGLDVKTRDGFKCQECGKSEDLHAHHIIPWKHDETKRFDLDNGITLCRSCHSRIERLLEVKMGTRKKRKK